MTMHHHPFLPYARRRGFTIVEIVMALIIISILTLVMVPVLTNRASEARLRACGQELEHLADAEERAAIDTGYLYRVYVLNDVGGKGDDLASAPKVLPTSGNQMNKVDALRDNLITDNIYEKPSNIFIEISGAKTKTTSAGQQFLDDTMQTSLFNRLCKLEDFTSEEKFNWNGPYINWKHDVNQNDWPDDPWGKDYLLFTWEGVIYPPDRSKTSQTDVSYKFQKTMEIEINGSAQQVKADEIFDRPTFVSLGPNGLPGNGLNVTSDPESEFGKGDDITRSFGGR